MYDRVRVRDKCMIVLGSGAGSGPGLCATLPVSFRGEGGGLVEAFAPIEQPCTTLQCSLELHCNATHAVHLVCIWCASGLHVLCICHVSDVYLSRVCGVSVTYVPCIWCACAVYLSRVCGVSVACLRCICHVCAVYLVWSWRQSR